MPLPSCPLAMAAKPVSGVKMVPDNQHTQTHLCNLNFFSKFQFFPAKFVCNTPVSMVKQARRPTRLSSTGLEVHEPQTESGLGVRVNCPFEVFKLERVGGHVVDLNKHL